MDITDSSKPAIHHRYREDGWTPDVQRRFIDALAACGSVAEACRVVNRSASTAYRLRAKPAAKAFRDAWTAAQGLAYRQVFEMAMDRAVIGTEQPIYHKGEQVGFKTTYSDRLLCYLLGHLKPDVVPARPAHRDEQDFALAKAVVEIDLQRVADDEDIPEDVLDAMAVENEALDAWRDKLDGVPVRRDWLDESEDAPAAPASETEFRAEHSSFAPFPTADDLRAMTPEERDAFDREEDAAFEETVKLGRSVGIEPGFANADSCARAVL